MSPYRKSLALFLFAISAAAQVPPVTLAPPASEFDYADANTGAINEGQFAILGQSLLAFSTSCDILYPSLYGAQRMFRNAQAVLRAAE